MDYNALADLLFPGLDEEAAIAKIEADYPPRSLPEGAKVTRMAPSPTGFMHLGNLFGAIADERLAHQSGGVFYLRIEDTDQKREVPGAVETILKVFSDYELPFDEGATADGDNGAYGPYRQRQREGIYRAYAKRLVRQGKAYPCFCTEEELAAIREKQAAEKANFGYYGSWAVHRDTPLSEVESRVAAGEPFVLRFRSEGDPGRRTKFTDLVRGDDGAARERPGRGAPQKRRHPHLPLCARRRRPPDGHDPRRARRGVAGDAAHPHPAFRRDGLEDAQICAHRPAHEAGKRQ